MGFRVMLLVAGVFACSTAVIWIKLSSVHPVLVSGYRLVFAAVLLSPLFLRELARHRGRYGWTHVRRTLLPAALLAAHFISWTFGARGTSAANATLIVNMVPVALPFFLWFSLREVVNAREVAGSVLALAGVVLLTAGDFALLPGHVTGDVLCFLSMLLIAGYLAAGRRNRDFPSLWLYVIPMYALAGAACFAVAPFCTDVLAVYPGREYLLLLALALVPTIIGHSALNSSMKHLRGQVVSIFNLGQFLFAGMLAWALFGEVPGWLFFAACSLIVAGAAITIFNAPAPATCPVVPDD